MGRFALRNAKGFTLIELLIVIIIIGILAAIAIPMFLGQRDKAKGAAVKGGIHNIELGIASYAVDNGDTYPVTATVTRATLVDASPSHVPYVDNWPQNPWGGGDMTEGATRGNYVYTNLASVGSTFRIVGYGQGGTAIFSAP